MKDELARRESNKARVLAYLQQHGSAFNYELVEIGGMRAMARAWELAREGWPVDIERVKGGLWKVTLHRPQYQLVPSAKPVHEAEQASLWEAR